MPTLSEFSDYVHTLSTESSKASGSTSTAKLVSSNKTQNSNSSIQAELDVLGSLSLSDKPATAKNEPHISFITCLLTATDNEGNTNQAISTLRNLLEDGRGECLVKLDQDPVDPSIKRQLSSADYDTALMNLKALCARPLLDCAITELYAAQDAKSDEKSGEVLIRERNLSVSDLLEIRIAVVGNVDAGKSTLLGVLTKGGLDDGRGKARVNLFRHKHEIESGRTSSVGMEIMGFDAEGKVVGANDGTRKASWKEIVSGSRKVITFIDLAGHEKYLKTTVFGLMGGSPGT